MSKTTFKLKYMAINLANKMYGYIEDLNDILSELSNDPCIDDYTRRAIVECYLTLPEPEFLDELIARLGCIDDEEEEMGE